MRIKGSFIFISVFPYFRISSYFRMGNQTDVTGFVLTRTDAKQNEFVVVSTKESAYQLSTDMRLVVDLIELFFAAACGAFVFVRLLGLPLHGGYVLAGIVIGPSGMNVVGEIVQVRALFIYISISIYFRVGNLTEALCFNSYRSRRWRTSAFYCRSSPVARSWRRARRNAGRRVGRVNPMNPTRVGSKPGGWD